MAVSPGQEWSMDQSSEQALQALIAEPSIPPRRVPQQSLQSNPILTRCPICSSDIPSSELTVLSPCNHRCCNQCLTDYLSLKICELTINLLCPYYKCQTKIPRTQIQEVVNEAVYEKWCRFEKIEFLERDVRLRWCPRPDCEGFDYGDENKRTLTCQVCSFTYCYLCNKEWHGSVLCEGEEMPRGVKFCPRCSIKVEKVPDTCDFMVCKRCEYSWCWKCGNRHTTFHELTCAFSEYSIYKTFYAYFGNICILPFVIICCSFCEVFRWFFIHFLCTSRSYTVRVAFIVMTSILSALLTPPVHLLHMLFPGVYVVFNSDAYMRDSILNRVHAHPKLRIVGFFLLGVLISPLIHVLALLYIPLGPVFGLILLVWKIRRARGKVLPVLVKNAIPGYRVGE